MNLRGIIRILGIGHKNDVIIVYYGSSDDSIWPIFCSFDAFYLLKTAGYHHFSFRKTFSRTTEQGQISFLANQRVCLRFCPRPIRMRKM